MEEQELLHRIDELEKKIDEMHKVLKRIYTIFIWTGIVTVAAIVLPLIGLIFVLPSFIGYYTNIGSMLQTLQ